MASSSEPTSQKVSAHDVLAFSDADLVQYMQQHRRDGRFVLEPHGWDKLPKDKRDKLAERLKFGAYKIADATPSQPVDLDQVTARLCQEAANNNPPPQTYDRCSTTSPSPPDPESLRKIERVYYEDLVAKRCWPCYPIALQVAVSENPSKYRAMLRPWQAYLDLPEHPHWEVFSRQTMRWDDFCIWQLVMRDIYDHNAEYLPYTERWKRVWIASEDTRELAEHAANPSVRKRAWDRLWWERRRNFRHISCPEAEEGGTKKTDPSPGSDEYFHRYVDNVRLRLAQHGFTRPFQLKKDPEQQDRLMTWIEYLAFEYSWYDFHIRTGDKEQLKHDETWAKLAESGVLRSGETQESLFTIESAMQRQHEHSRAENALKAAEKAARSAENQPERGRSLARAQSRLAAAQEAWKKHKRRDDLIDHYIQEGKDYQHIKNHTIYRQSILLQWILEQIPLIEAEMKSESGAVENPASSLEAQPASSHRPSPAPSHRVHSGRITKAASQGQHSKGKKDIKILEVIGYGAQTTTPPRRQRQHKTYKKERASRRLAGQAPEFGIFSERGNAPPWHEAP